MTLYSFKPNASIQSVDWHDPAAWAGGVVPNAPDADVDFPVVTQVSTGQTYTSFVSILTGESYAIRSLALRDYLTISGSLTISGQLTQDSYGEINLSGGTLTAGSIVNDNLYIQGDGHIVVGTLTNDGFLVGGNLTIDATELVNSGTLGGSGTTTVNVADGGFTGLSNGTLSSGTLYGGGTLALHVGSTIATDAAMITLDGGTITSRDPATGQDVALTSSLHQVAAGGTLAINSGTYHFGQLTVAGTLNLAGLNRAHLSADGLVIGPGGHLTGTGTLDSPLENDGIIQVGHFFSNTISGYGGLLVLGGAVTGSGSIEILPASAEIYIHQGYFHSGPMLEIAGPTAQHVVFDDAYGTLKLDQPESFTGVISVVSGSPGSYYSDHGADTILLPNVDFSSITGESYVGTAAGGTLTLQEASGAITLRFTGNHTLGNFTITSVPGVLSSDPVSVKITVEGHGQTPTGDFSGDAHSDILWQNANGAISTWHATGSGASDGIVQDTYDAHVATSWTAIDSFDFNGDGLADILWRNRDGTIAVWDGTPSGFTQSSYVDSSIPSTTAIVGAGDFNGDGHDDLLFRDADGSISAEPSNGSRFQIGYDSSYNHGSISTSWLVEGVADFTGDGKADILWRNTDGSLSTWNAIGSSTQGTDFRENSWFHGPIDRSWHVVGLGDFNGDGLADILWRNDNGAVSVWTSNGSGSFAENQFNASAATNWSVAETGDFNGDGQTDILWRNSAGQISIWHSTGSGWAQNTYSDGSVGTDWTIAAHHFPL